LDSLIFWWLKGQIGDTSEMMMLSVAQPTSRQV